MFFNYLKTIWIPMVLVALIYFCTGCGDSGDKPVAKVGGRIITVNDFKDGFSRGKSIETISKATLQDKRDHLEKMIERELQIVAGYQQNMGENENVLQKVESRLEATILRRLVEKEVIEPNIPESDIKKFYDKSKKQANVQEISIRLSTRATEQELRIVKDRISAIKNELSNGTPFIDVMNKYSSSQKAIDPETAANTTLKIFPSNEDDPLIQTAFSMKAGEVSDTIRTNSGYSIIKLISIDEDELKPYSVERRRIRQELLRLRGKELEKTYFDYLDALKDKYKASYSQENIEMFVSQLNDTSDSRLRTMPTRDPFARITPDIRKLQLATYEGGDITVDEFIDGLKEYPVTRTPEFKNKEDVHTNIDTRVLPRKLMFLEAEKKNLRNDPEVKAQQKEFIESFMLSEIRKTNIDDRVVLNEDSLRSYYEQHKEEYKEPPTREVREIFVSDLELANKIYQRAIAGENFVTLARKYNEKQQTKDNDGYLGFIPKTRHKIGEAAFGVPINGITKPVVIGSKYSIIKVLSEKESTLKTFEEAKPFLRVKAGREQKEKIEKKWFDGLRENIKVIVYEKRLGDTFAELTEE
ncbi:peptidyl-prolyl cis-trans isomerase [candidate division KSB1 bacterium]|nr:peptidyl-prolyl cis-trans isomerase [candidate division KSB1 bacterium]